MPTPFYVTTPIYYVNDSPHLGHAYTSVACDALARFQRLDGKQVLFLTGTDEHGQKVAKSARDAGVDPQAFCDRVSENFRAMTKQMNISNDQFIRTTEPRHIKASQALWQELEKRGEIYLGRFKGWYSVRDEAFYEESELIAGKTPGAKLAPTGAEVEWVEEENYFFSYRPGRTACWPITTRIPISLHRARAATRSSASSKAGSTICRSRAPASIGACRCPAIPSTSCMSGSTR
jgi:methionyl-tRNA synthetase